MGVIQVKGVNEWVNSLDDCYEIIEQHLGQDIVRFMIGEIADISEDKTGDLLSYESRLDEYNAVFTDILDLIRLLGYEFDRNRWNKSKILDIVDDIESAIVNVY